VCFLLEVVMDDIGGGDFLVISDPFLVTAKSFAAAMHALNARAVALSQEVIRYEHAHRPRS